MIWAIIIFILCITAYGIIAFNNTKDEIIEKEKSIQKTIKANGIKVKEQFNLPGGTIVINDSAHRAILLIEGDDTRRIPHRDIVGLYLYEDNNILDGYLIPMGKNNKDYEYIDNPSTREKIRHRVIRLELKTNEEYFREDIEIVLFSSFDFVNKNSYAYESSYDKTIGCYELLKSIMLENIRYRKTYYGHK